MRHLIALLLLALPAFAAKPQLPTYKARLVNFTEERYNEPQILDSRRMNSCVNRDYTLETATHIVVARQSTCYPNRNRALGGVIGQEVEWQEDGKGRIGIVGQRKVHWFRVFKVTQKE